MSKKEIEKLREELNGMIEKGAKPEDILKVSIELDHLIEKFIDNVEKKV